MRIVVSDLGGSGQLAFLDEVAAWPEVTDARLPDRTRDGVVAEAVAVVLVVTTAAHALMAIAKTVKYIQDNFHRPVLVDLSGEEPQVRVLPGGPGLLGRTFVRNTDGQVELAQNVSAPQLAEDIKALMPRP